MKEAAPVPAPSRSRLWVRLLWWCGGAAGLVFILAAVAMGWLWTHQTEAVNGALDRLPMPVKAQAGTVEVSPSKVTLKNVALRDPTSGKVWIQMKQVEWTPEWSAIPRGVIGTLTVKGAAVDLDRATFEKLSQPATVSGSEEPAAASSTGFKMDKLALEDVHVKVAAQGSYPALEFDLEHHSTGIDLSDPQHLAIQSFNTQLRRAVVGTNGEATLASFAIDGALRPEDGILKIRSVECSGGTLNPAKALLALLEQPTASPKSTAPSAIKGIEIDHAALRDLDLRAASGTEVPAWWPHLKGRFTGTLKDLRWSEASGLKMGPQTLEVAQLELQPPTPKGRLAIGKGSLTVESNAGGGFRVMAGQLDNPEVDWTPELEAYLMPTAVTPKPATSPATSPGATTPSPTVMVDSFSIHNAALSLKRTPKVGYDGHAHLDLTLSAFTVGPSGWSSTQPQTLSVRDLVLAEHVASKEKPFAPFARLESGRFVIVPDEWKKSTKIQELTLTKPVVRIREDNVSWLDSAAPETAPDSTALSTDDDWMQALNFDKLEVDAGDCDVAMNLPQPAELRTKFSITTDLKSHIHRLDLRKTRGLLPHLAKLPVAGIEKLEVAVRLPEMWQNKRVEELKLKGMELEVGDALMTLGKELEAEEAKEDAIEAVKEAKSPFIGPPEPSPLRDWRVGTLSIDDVAVTLQRVAPGLPPMKFDIRYDAQEMPLDPDQLAGNFKPQRIELTQLAIKSPYNPLREVARLDTVFVDFTLDGLLRERIDQIEIVSPTLYVGEDLFWYIDYYRKFAAGQTLPKAGPQMVAVGNFAALEAATAQAAAPAKEAHAWTINTLAVHAGKLIIAPKGTPLPGFPRPFPFSFVSKLDKGQIEAEFDIPSDTYTWQELKIALEGMRGHVLFNLPVKGQDNNLTETFNVDRIRYNQLHMENAHLSVTYDVNGIYGKFGSAAYEGYVNGAFNVYLDQTFSWDGWISGIGVRATEITQKISPAYFLLAGKVDLTLVMQGNMNELYQADVKFTNATPGKFSIQALNDALKSVPSDSAAYQQDIMRIGVETLRDFDYDKVDGQCRFYGREGKGHLRFNGPHGSRNIELNVYDHRWNTEKPKPPAPLSAKTVHDDPETE